MQNRNQQDQNDNVESKGGAKTFWRNFGVFFLALALGVLTVVVISLP